MPFPDDKKILSLIVRYQQSLFSFVLSLSGGNKNAAYDLAVSSFVQAVQSTRDFGRDNQFFVTLMSGAIDMTRGAKVMPCLDESGGDDGPAQKRKSLQIIKTALHELPFDSRVCLLLRDQLHISYKTMGAILRVAEKAARIRTSESRVQLRTKIEEVLKRTA